MSDLTREEAITALGDRNNLLWGMSKEEQKYYSEALDMAISALSEELSEDGTLTVHVSDGSKVNRVFVMGDNIFGGLYYPDSDENKGDLISRQAVLDELEKWDWQDLYLPSHFKQILDDVPSVENKGEWIPVTERLPEDHQNILFSTKTDRVFEGRYFKDETEQQWYSFRDECFAWNNVVTAWQPLPEPYIADMREPK